MRKKGFTLVELLAVIVILAIIALIATPMILGIIDDAKKNSAKASALGYVSALEKQIVLDMINPSEAVIDLSDDIVTVGTDDVGLTMKGVKPDNGSTVIVNKSTGKIISGKLSITLNGKKYDYNYEGETGTILEKGPSVEIPDSNIMKGVIKIVYLDPTDTTKKCNAGNSVSTTGTKNGCMKWYAYKDDGENYTMILDHNTSGNVAWASGSYSDVSNTLNERLSEDTKNWIGNPRIIKIQEIADITGATEALQWDSSKSFKNVPEIGTHISTFYFDGADGTDPLWQTQVAKSKGASKYAWLFDNTGDCIKNGCNIEDNNKYPYGTSGNESQVYGYWSQDFYWTGGYPQVLTITNYGKLGFFIKSWADAYGIRPVITIAKDIVD